MNTLLLSYVSTQVVWVTDPERAIYTQWTYWIIHFNLRTHYTHACFIFRAELVLSWLLLVFSVLALVGMVCTPLHAWLVAITSRREGADDERTRLMY